MKKRHRAIDPAKARAAAGGGIGWYERIIPTPDPSPSKKEIDAPTDSPEAADGEEVPFLG